MTSLLISLVTDFVIRKVKTWASGFVLSCKNLVIRAISSRCGDKHHPQTNPARKRHSRSSGKGRCQSMYYYNIKRSIQEGFNANILFGLWRNIKASWHRKAIKGFFSSKRCNITYAYYILHTQEFCNQKDFASATARYTLKTTEEVCYAF